MIKIVKVESKDNDYLAGIKRPDGSIVKVLIPREDSSTSVSYTHLTLPTKRIV